MTSPLILMFRDMNEMKANVSPLIQIVPPAKLL